MKSNNIIRVLLTLIIIVVVGIILVFTYNILIDNSDVEVTSTPVQTEKVVKPNVDVLSYQVYDLDNISFDFILAKIRVKDTSTNSDLNLSNYVTSEGLNLTDISDYKEELEVKGYYLGKQSVIFNLSEQSDTYFATIFIPYNEETKELIVNNSISDNQLIFNLDNKTGTAESLYYDSNDVITDGINYQMTISGAKQIGSDIFTRVLGDGTIIDNPIPSTSEIYAFDVVATSLNSEVITIESATYVVDDSNQEFEALDEAYQSPLYNNIIGEFITDDSTGSVFIMTLNPNKDKINYHGTLKLQISNVVDPVSIKVDID